MSHRLIHPKAGHDQESAQRRERARSQESSQVAETRPVGGTFFALGLDPRSQVSALSQADGTARARAITRLQKTHGNAFVQRAVARPCSMTLDFGELARRIQAASKGGSGLDPGVRTKLEAGLGADLSTVRVHVGAEADRLACDVDSAAFTTGQDIFFRTGMYGHRSPDGLRLLAHEATHAVQHGTGRSWPGREGLKLSKPGDASEREAEEVAGQIVAGQKTSVSAASGATIARGIWDEVTGGVSDAWDWARGTVSDAASGVSDTASRAWDWTRGAAGDVVSGVGDTASRAWDWTRGFASDAGDVAGSALMDPLGAASRAWDLGTGAVSDVREGIRDTRARAFDWTRGAAGDVVSGVGDTASRGLDWARGAVSDVRGGIRDTRSRALDWAGGAASDVAVGVGDTASRAWDWGTGVASDVGSGIGGVASRLWAWAT